MRVVAVAMMLMFVPAAVDESGFSAATTARDDAFLRGYPTSFVTRDVHLSRCNAIDALEGALAYATIDVNAHVPFPGVDRQGRYYGRTVFAIQHVTLRLPRSIEWPQMTEAERTEVRKALAALRHHEVGHVRVAAAEVARLNAAPLTVTFDAELYRRTEMRRQSAGLDELARAQERYDALTAHGRRQLRAAGVLAGSPTELPCSRAEEEQPAG